MIKIHEELKAYGLKATVSRIDVLKAFKKTPAPHLSADDIYRILVRQHTKVSLATIYRILSDFNQAGILNQHRFNSTKAVYELRNKGKHDHIICIDNGKVTEFYDHKLHRGLQQLVESYGMKMDNYVLTIYAVDQANSKIKI